MIIFLSVVLAVCVAFMITAIIVDVSNNKGNSKATIEDISEKGFVIIKQHDAKRKKIKLEDFEK